MTAQMYVCLGIFVFMILGYCFAGKLKTTTGVVALCTIVLTIYSGLVEPKDVLPNFSNTNVILILSMFIVAAGLNRTQAVSNMSAMVYRFSHGNFTAMLSGYILLTFLLANFIPSPLAVYAIVCPLVANMCKECGVSPSKAMFPICLVDVGTCAALPIANGAVTFATMNGYLESYGYTEFQMGILDNFIGRAPMVIVVLLYALFIAPRFCPSQPSVAILSDASGSGKKEAVPLNAWREFLGYFIFIMTTLALIFQKQLGLTSWQIALTGAAVVVASGVLSPREAVNAIPVRIMLLLIAALTVGGAMVSSGLGDLIGNTLAAALGGTTNGYVIGAVFFVIPFILTQFMQNQSVSNIFIPIVILTCKALHCNPVGPLILLNAACLTAFLTPMATPVIPVVMDAGGYTMKDLFKMGLLPSLIIPVVSVFWVMTVFPAY